MLGCLTFMFAACKESPQERCARSVDAVNRGCPKAIDAYTQLDSVAYWVHENAIHYYYSLHGAPDSVLRSGVDDSPEGCRRMAEQIANTPDMRYFVEHNVSFRYHYVSKETGKQLGTIVVDN